MSTSSVGSARGTVTRTGRLKARGSPTSPVATAYASVSAEATTGDATAGDVRLGIARAHRDPGRRGRVELAGDDARVGLDEARAGRDEVRRARRPPASTSSICRDGTARRKSSREGTRLLLRSVAAANRSRSVAPLSPPRSTCVTGCPARSRTARTCPCSSSRSGSTAPRSTLTTSSQGAPGVRRERAVGLGAALVAQEHLRALVAHEERRGRADLRRERREHAALAHRQQARARPGELEHHGRAARLLDPAHDVAEPASQELERDVARADEGAQPPAEEHLHAHRRANEHGPVRERLRQRGGRDDQREHPDAADAREARLVGHAEPRRAREALEVHGRRKARRRRAPRGRRERASPPTAARVDSPARSSSGDAARCRTRSRPRRWASSGPRRCAAARARTGARASTIWSTVDLDHILRKRRIARARGEDLLGHRAGRIPGSCAHGSVCLEPQIARGRGAQSTAGARSTRQTASFSRARSSALRAMRLTARSRRVRRKAPSTAASALPRYLDLGALGSSLDATCSRKRCARSSTRPRAASPASSWTPRASRSIRTRATTRPSTSRPSASSSASCSARSSARPSRSKRARRTRSPSAPRR